MCFSVPERESLVMIDRLRGHCSLLAAWHMIWALVIKGLLPKRHTQKGSPFLFFLLFALARIFFPRKAQGWILYILVILAFFTRMPPIHYHLPCTHHTIVYFFSLKERVKSCTCLVIPGHDNNIEKINWEQASSVRFWCLVWYFQIINMDGIFVSLFFILTAVLLVTPIWTLWTAWTLQMTGNTLETSTLELVWSAVDVLTMRFIFIGTIRTVLIIITNPIGIE